MIFLQCSSGAGIGVSPPRSRCPVRVEFAEAVPLREIDLAAKTRSRYHRRLEDFYRWLRVSYCVLLRMGAQAKGAEETLQCRSFFLLETP